LSSRNKKTIERAKATAKAIAEVREHLIDVEINELTPLETMLMAMRASMMSGDWWRPWPLPVTLCRMSTPRCRALRQMR
jgi:hypothetical protein